MEVIVFAILTVLSTFFGGLIALKLRGKLHYVMGFTAGVIMGVIAFDIFPEIFENLEKYNLEIMPIMVFLMAGFLVFHILEKAIVIHHNHEEDYATHTHPHVGIASALALIGHSFMDGVSIGVGFQVSAATGILIAVAVISHDFVDGINTVTLMLAHKNTLKRSIIFLVFDALAPILGVLLTLAVTFSPRFLIAYLGFFAGFLLYIGASDILPEAHNRRKSYLTIVLTILGVIFAYFISRILV